MSVLRRRLDEISLRPPGEHRERVQALSGACPHTIKYIEDDGGERSECMLYALEIPFELVNEVATFKCILDDFFIALPTLLEKISDSEVSAGLVILYFKDGKTKHVGRMCGNRVLSKWEGNPVYEHDTFEVPASYGDEYKFFKQPSVRYITDKFIEFVRSHPRYIDLRDGFEEIVLEQEQ